MTNTTATYARLEDGSWGIQGHDLVSGQTVTVTRKIDNTTKQVVVGEIVTPLNKWGKTVARIGQAEVTAEVAVAARPADKVTEEGFYLYSDEVFRVVTSKSSGRLYAKKVTADGWDFEAGKGMMRVLTAADKMTPEQIAARGMTTKVCCACSTKLEDPVSKDIGLGTKCGPDILGSEAYKAACKASKAKPEIAAAVAERKAARDAAKTAPVTVTFRIRGQVFDKTGNTLQAVVRKQIGANRTIEAIPFAELTVDEQDYLQRWNCGNWEGEPWGAVYFPRYYGKPRECLGIILAVREG